MYGLFKAKYLERDVFSKFAILYSKSWVLTEGSDRHAHVLDTPKCKIGSK